MLGLADPGDTWGISGPDFLVAYLGALGVFLVGGVIARLIITSAGGASTTRTPTAGEAAILQGGRSRALYASLAGLHAAGAVGLRGAGAVGLGERGALTATGPVPTAGSRLDHAIHDAAGRGVRVTDLAADHSVRSALDQLDADIERSAWVLDSSRRSQARLGGWLLVTLGGFGFVRLIAGIANDKAVGFVAALAIVAVIVGGILLRVPRMSPTGKQAIAQARRANAHLAPYQSPAWSTYGMAGAAMGVALFGTAAIWAADPAFAGEAGIRRSADSGGSGWIGDSGGSGGSADGG